MDLMLDLVGNKSDHVSARIEQMPFTDNQFDLVLSVGNIFDDAIYDHDHNKMMREIHRVLKPKGLYLCYGLTKIKASPINGVYPIS